MWMLLWVLGCGEMPTTSESVAPTTEPSGERAPPAADVAVQDAASATPDTAAMTPAPVASDANATTPDVAAEMTPAARGAIFDEILRVVDALQLADAKSIVTPADWVPGGKVIIPTSITNDQAKEMFPQGWEEQRPYLRVTSV